jgi:hypothetical protein
MEEVLAVPAALSINNADEDATVPAKPTRGVALESAAKNARKSRKRGGTTYLK